MNVKRVWMLAAALSATLSGAHAVAHHGGAAYDSGSMITLTGKVTEFRFVNPHVLISIAVTGDDGETVEWSGELTSPNRLARMSRSGGVRWTPEVLKAGDEIELTGNPATSGAPALRLHKVVDAKGRVLIDD